MSEYPAWTARGDGGDEHGGRWALGLEPMGFRMTRLLLPAITNATRRVRYYSFLAWVFWTFQEHLRRHGVRQATGRDQDLWRRRLENAWRAASLHLGYHDGLVGERTALRLPGGDESFSLDQNDPANAWRADTYKSSWLGLNLGHVDGKVAVLHPYPGEWLARGFEETIRRVDAGRGLREQLLDGSGVVPASVLRELAPALSLSEVGEDAPEHAALVDALFRLSGEEEPQSVERRNAVRRHSLTLLLDLLGASQGSLQGEQDLHGVLALGRFPDGRAYEPPPGLAQTFQSWRCYQLREQEKLALYGLWEEVLRGIRESPTGRATGAQEIGRVLEAVRISAIAREWFGGTPLNLTVDEALSRIPSEEGAREALAHAMCERLLDLTDPDHPGAAVVLLLAVCARWRAMESALPDAARKLLNGVDSELPLPLVVRQVSTWGPERLGSLLAWCVERWVLAQSLAVALQKWRRGEDRFFIARDFDGYRIVQDHPSRNFLVFDRPRIWSSLQLLRDLKLVRMDGNLRATSLGCALRDRVLENDERRSALA